MVTNLKSKCSIHLALPYMKWCDMTMAQIIKASIMAAAKYQFRINWYLQLEALWRSLSPVSRLCFFACAYLTQVERFAKILWLSLSPAINLSTTTTKIMFFWGEVVLWAAEYAKNEREEKHHITHTKRLWIRRSLCSFFLFLFIHPTPFLHDAFKSGMSHAAFQFISSTWRSEHRRSATTF